MQEGSQFGPYLLLKRIATGGMAEIYLAKTTGIGGFEKLLALKVIHPKYSEDEAFISMLIDEAKITVNLNHANICQIFDLGEHNGTFFIAMEFIDGKDLYQTLIRCSELGREIPFDILTYIIMDAAAGLHYAHTRSDNYGRPLNLVHRDVSPQNILLSYDGEVKVIDFGIAKANQRQSNETEAGVIKGKFVYMSPEQAWGSELDARSDIFSLGICLYEMICGEMLYADDNIFQLLDKVRKAEIPSMRERRPDLPEALEKIALKALAQAAGDRYQTAAEFQGALTGFLYTNWPDFNRGRVKDFMREIFGDRRFIMPLPQKEAPRQIGNTAPPLNASNLMSARDFAANNTNSLQGAKSLIFSVDETNDGNDDLGNGGMSDIADLEDLPQDKEDEDRTMLASELIIEKKPHPGSAPSKTTETPSNFEPTVSASSWEELDAVDDDETAAITDAQYQSFRETFEDAGSTEAPAAALPPISTPSIRSRTEPEEALLLTRRKEPAPDPVSRQSIPPMISRSSGPLQPLVSRASAPYQPIPRLDLGQETPEPLVNRATLSYGSRNTLHQMPPTNNRKKVLIALCVGIVCALVFIAFLLASKLTTTGSEPAVAPAAAVNTVTLDITTVPAGATIIYNGTPLSQASPARLSDLPLNTPISFKFTHKGYKPIEQQITLTEPGTHQLDPIVLEPAPVRIWVESVPTNARVILDQVELGSTPKSRNIDRPKRDSILDVSLDGYKRHVETIHWGDEDEIHRVITLERR